MTSRPPDAVSAERMVAFLCNSKSYPDAPRRIRLIQTYTSYVALTARHAYKVKKPVNYGFLDFSTLAKRRHFCEREVELNRRLCEGIHIGVVPISATDGALAFGSGGRVVEYAVKMRRLPERYFMLHRMERGRVGTSDVDAIIATLKPFYEAQVPTPEIAQWGRVQKLKISTDENFQQTKDFVGVTITRAAFEASRVYTNSFFETG